MTEINLTSEQEKELKNIVETDGCDFKAAEENAKADLTELAKSVEEIFGVTKSDFKRMVTLTYKSKFDEERAKNEFFNELYEKVMNNE
jgi:hypothetical protein